MKKFLTELLKWLFYVGFSGLLVGPMTKLVEKLKWIDNAQQYFQKLLEPQFSTLELIVFLLILIIVATISSLGISIVKKHKDIAKANTPQEKLKQFNSFIDEENEIKFTWDVYFGSIYNNDPFASNIRMFCLKHNPPQIMKSYGCSIQGCPNGNFMTTDSEVKRWIESMLFQKYEDLKNETKGK